MSHDELERLKNEYETIINSVYDEIVVINAEGIVISINKACERFYNKKAEEIVGRHVKELVKEGVFWPSILETVCRTRSSESVLQTTEKGRKILVTAIPILNEEGKVVKIVSNSRDLTELVLLKRQLEEKEQLVSQYTGRVRELKVSGDSTEKLVYVNAQMEKVNHLIEKVAASDINILIQGESGVGKTMIAEIIHNKSNRAKGPFQVINCSAIPETLLESELFGYETGAFTGALKQGKAGLFQLAEGGTIFLDEIGEISTALQAKLLQVIQTRKFRKIGGLKEIEANFRLITATNQDLTQKIRGKSFREDFYYRINGVSINLPPLRERKEDIGIMANLFLEQFNAKYGLNKRFSAEVLDVFYKYHWPGNVRELKNLIERLCLVSEYELIMIHDLPEHLMRYVNFVKLAQGIKTQEITDNTIPLHKAVELVEESLVNLAYQKHKNTYKVAEVLGVSQPTAHRLIKKYVLDSEVN